MATHARYGLPQFVQRGLTTSLSLDVYDDDGTQQVGTTHYLSGTVSVYAGSRLVVDAGTVILGTSVSATYSLTAATTTSEALSDDWLGIWTFIDADSAAAVESIHRPISLVRRILTPVITDTDLTNLHRDLNDLLCAGTTTWETERVAAWEQVERELLRRARRPQLIMDSWALLDVHRYLTLRNIFRDAVTSMGDGRYRTLVDQYDALIKAEWEAMQFRYDDDGDGLLDDGAQIGSKPVLYLSSAPGWGGS